MDPNAAEVKRLLESAQRGQSIGEWAAIAAVVLLALTLLYGAYHTYRHGLKITKEKTVTGTPAVVTAIALIVLAVGGVVVTFFFWPGLLR